jgi:hypothetical protein
VAAGKRWITIATEAAGGWRIAAAEMVGPPESLLARLRALAAGSPVALGVDFPLGLPIAYVHAHPPGMPNFPEFLRVLGDRPTFFDVAATLEDISGARPFYPARGRAGMTRAAHAAALGLPDAAALSRACDRATAHRPAGAPVFWTLGANQIGKAALHAWRHLVIPALSDARPPRIWPFAGAFLTLLQPDEVAIAETYPAEALRHLNMRLRGSKRRQPDRQALAPALHAAIAAVSGVAEDALSRAIIDGFGMDAAAEDGFDSLLGVLCVLNVLAGRRPDHAPAQEAITRWEGWVLGQAEPPEEPPPLVVTW